MSSSLGLTSNTALEKEELKNLNTLINLLWDDKSSLEFRQPVDYKCKIK